MGWDEIIQITRGCLSRGRGGNTSSRVLLVDKPHSHEGFECKVLLLDTSSALGQLSRLLYVRDVVAARQDPGYHDGAYQESQVAHPRGVRDHSHAGE